MCALHAFHIHFTIRAWTHNSYQFVGGRIRFSQAWKTRPHHPCRELGERLAADAWASADRLLVHLGYTVRQYENCNIGKEWQKVPPTSQNAYETPKKPMGVIYSAIDIIDYSYSGCFDMCFARNQAFSAGRAVHFGKVSLPSSVAPPTPPSSGEISNSSSAIPRCGCVRLKHVEAMQFVSEPYDIIQPYTSRGFMWSLDSCGCMMLRSLYTLHLCQLDSVSFPSNV